MVRIMAPNMSFRTGISPKASGDDLEAPASVLALTRDSRAVSLREQPLSPRPFALLNKFIVLFAATPVVAPISICALILIARIEEPL